MLCIPCRIVSYRIEQITGRCANSWTIGLVNTRTGRNTSGNVVGYVLSTTCLHINQKAHVASNFNCLFESERVLKVTGIQIHCTC